jgi:1-acyl-sn-glycerol-3-phosphate acyltransferase
MQDAQRMLEAGYSVGIFPEGTFSPRAGGFQEPRTGAARLAIRTGVPVIPVGIYLPRERSLKIESRLSGTPTIGYWYLRGPYAITVGQAMKFQGDPDDKLHVHSITRNIMEWIHSLAEESELRLRRLLPSQVPA